MFAQPEWEAKVALLHTVSKLMQKLKDLIWIYLDNPDHCWEVLETRFPHGDIVKCGATLEH